MKKCLLIILSIILLPAYAESSKILPSEIGIVQNVQYVDLNNNDVSQTKQIAKIKLLTGDFKGETVELDNMLTGNPYYDIKLKKEVCLFMLERKKDYTVLFQLF